MLYIITIFFENMNFMTYCGGVNYSKNIFMFHGEWKYLNMMHVLHLNLYHQCEQLCNTLIYLNKYVWHDIVSME